MKALNQKQQLNLITALLRGAVWLIWVLLIALDGLGASINISEAMYWLPFVGMGLLMAWSLDGFIRDDQIGRLLIFIIPYLVLADFVQG